MWVFSELSRKEIKLSFNLLQGYCKNFAVWIRLLSPQISFLIWNILSIKLIEICHITNIFKLYIFILIKANRLLQIIFKSRSLYFLSLKTFFSVFLNVCAWQWLILLLVCFPYFTAMYVLFLSETFLPVL